MKALISLWSLKKRKVDFIEKVKKKDFKVRRKVQMNIFTLKHQKGPKVQALLLRPFLLQFIKIMLFNIMLKSI